MPTPREQADERLRELVAFFDSDNEIFVGKTIPSTRCPQGCVPFAIAHTKSGAMIVPEFARAILSLIDSLTEQRDGLVKAGNTILAQAYLDDDVINRHPFTTVGTESLCMVRDAIKNCDW